LLYLHLWVIIRSDFSLKLILKWLLLQIRIFCIEEFLLMNSYLDGNIFHLGKSNPIKYIKNLKKQKVYIRKFKSIHKLCQDLIILIIYSSCKYVNVKIWNGIKIILSHAITIYLLDQKWIFILYSITNQFTSKFWFSPNKYESIDLFYF